MSLAALGSAALPSNVLLALLAALVWGGGDFAGGMGVKVSGGGTRASLRVTTLAHGLSLLALLGALAFGHPDLPLGLPTLWALLAGVTAGLSISAFYVALAGGVMGVAAAVSGLLSAALPAIASAFLEGRPSFLHLAGFGLGGAAIWLIATPGSAPTQRAPQESPGPASRHRKLFLLALMSGLGFGVYFLLLKLANPLGVLLPVTLARVGSVSTCTLLMLALRFSSAARPSAAQPAVSELQPKPATNPAGIRRSLTGRRLSRQAVAWAVAVALLDTLANLLYLQSTRAGRLDVAGVVVSLYPAGTILLAAFVLHERPTHRQLAGMGGAAVAVVLVTL